MPSFEVDPDSGSSPRPPEVTPGRLIEQAKRQGFWVKRRSGRYYLMQRVNQSLNRDVFSTYDRDAFYARIAQILVRDEYGEPLDLI